MDIQGAEKYILERLTSNLSETLYYHGVHHVLDVVDAAESIASDEGIDATESLALLRTAALYHDSGFLSKYQLHEEAGCEIVREALPKFNYNADQIEKICGMIMATKIPQSPKTHLEQIICDADLDYLGRSDFEPIAQTLFEELKVRSMVQDVQKWNEIQVKFLTSHHYWTKSAIDSRASAKQKHLEHLIELV